MLVHRRTCVPSASPASSQWVVVAGKMRPEKPESDDCCTASVEVPDAESREVRSLCPFRRTLR